MELHFVLLACLRGVIFYVMIVAKIIVNCMLLLTMCILYLIYIVYIIYINMCYYYETREDKKMKIQKNENVRSEEKHALFLVYQQYSLMHVT